MKISTTRCASSLESTEGTEEETHSITRNIIGAAIEVHRALGPGLLESAYEMCLSYELRLHKLKVETQKSIPVSGLRIQSRSHRIKSSHCRSKISQRSTANS